MFFTDCDCQKCWVVQIYTHCSGALHALYC